MTLNKALLSLLVLYGLLVSSSDAMYKAKISDPAFFYNSKAETIAKSTGAIISSSESAFTNDDGKEFFDYTAMDKDGVVAKGHTVYEYEKDIYTMISFSTEAKKNDKLIASVEMQFDWANKTAQLSINDVSKSKNISKTVKISDRMVTTADIGMFIRRMIYSKVTDDSMSLLLPNGDSIAMKAAVSYQPVTIQSRGNSHKCFKAKLKLDLGLISAILPSSTFYFETEAPHKFVRYEGLLGGPGSPDVIQEAVR